MKTWGMSRTEAQRHEGKIGVSERTRQQPRSFADYMYYLQVLHGEKGFPLWLCGLVRKTRIWIYDRI